MGVWIDEHLTLSHQIHQVCKSAFHQIFSVYKIRPHLTQAATQTLVQALVVSKLDYGNSLYYGLLQSLIYKLQLVQNAAAQRVCLVSKYDRIKHALKSLCWLPIQQ